jgi:hypothetical protein
MQPSVVIAAVYEHRPRTCRFLFAQGSSKGLLKRAIVGAIHRPKSPSRHFQPYALVQGVLSRMVQHDMAAAPVDENGGYPETVERFRLKLSDDLALHIPSTERHGATKMFRNLPKSIEVRRPEV